MKLSFHTEHSSSYWIYTACLFSAVSLSCANRLQCFMGQVSTKAKTPVHTVDCTPAANVRPITACLIFTYQTSADGYQHDTRLTYGGIGGDQFSCDKDHICERYRQGNGSWVRNVTYAGRQGDLYCCNTSACNDPGLVSVPRTNVPCFVGTTRDNKSSGSLQPCDSSQCYNTTSGNTTQHQCDTQGLCAKYRVTDQCQEVTEGGVQKRLCCCHKSGCNGPTGGAPKRQWLVAPSSHNQRSQPAVRPMAPMPPDLLPAARAERQRKSRVAGIVSAAVLGTALVVLVVVIAFKQWQRYREKYNFSYMQLTADMMVL